MSTCKISEKESTLLISYLNDGAGDFLVTVETNCDGYKGHADGHVAGDDWQKFLTDLRLLDATRKGSAEFASAIEGEFEISFHAIDSVGHMGVSGALSYRRVGVEEWPKQELHFAFKFDPAQLSLLVHNLSTVKAEEPETGTS
jgi:hypothetical protein